MSFRSKCRDIYSIFGTLIQMHIKEHGWESYCGLYYINHKDTGDIMVYASGKVADDVRKLIRDNHADKVKRD